MGAPPPRPLGHAPAMVLKVEMHDHGGDRRRYHLGRQDVSHRSASTQWNPPKSVWQRSREVVSLERNHFFKNTQFEGVCTFDTHFFQGEHGIAPSSQVGRRGQSDEHRHGACAESAKRTQCTSQWSRMLLSSRCACEMVGAEEGPAVFRSCECEEPPVPSAQALHADVSPGAERRVFPAPIFHG